MSQQSSAGGPLTTKTIGSSDPDGLVERVIFEVEFRHHLGGISERTFKSLRAQKVIPAPRVLGPRMHVWDFPQDVNAAIKRLPRKEPAPEPATLAAGRRRRIEAMKAGPANGAPA